jgi:hypothetical protein
MIFEDTYSPEGMSGTKLSPPPRVSTSNCQPVPRFRSRITAELSLQCRRQGCLQGPSATGFCKGLSLQCRQQGWPQDPSATGFAKGSPSNARQQGCQQDPSATGFAKGSNSNSGNRVAYRTLGLQGLHRALPPMQAIGLPTGP